MSDHPTCCAEVRGAHSWLTVFCSRVGSVERDGKWYCRQHDPAAVRARRDAADAKWARDNEARNTQLRLERAAPALLDALKRMVNAYWRGSEDSSDDDAPECVKAALAAIAKAEGGKR